MSVTKMPAKKKAKGEQIIGSLYFDDENKAIAYWRKMAAACRAAKNGSSADMRKSGKGWIVEVFQRK